MTDQERLAEIDQLNDELVAAGKGTIEPDQIPGLLEKTDADFVSALASLRSSLLSDGVRGTPAQQAARAHLLKVLTPDPDSDAEFDTGAWQRVSAWIANPRNAEFLAILDPDSVLRQVDNLVEAFAGLPRKEIKIIGTARIEQGQTDARAYLDSLGLPRDVLEDVDVLISNAGNARRLINPAYGTITEQVDGWVEEVEIDIGVKQLGVTRKRLQEHNDAISQAFKEAYLQRVVEPLNDIKFGKVPASSEAVELAKYMLDQVREDDFENRVETRYRDFLVKSQDAIGEEGAASFDAWVLTSAPLDLLRDDLGTIFKEAFPDLDLETSGIKDIRTFIENQLIPAQLIADRGLVATGRLQDELDSIEKILQDPGESDDRQDLYEELLDKLDDVRPGLERDYANLAKNGEILSVQGYLDANLLPSLSGTLAGSFGAESIVSGDLAVTLRQLRQASSPDETIAREEEIDKAGFYIVASKISDDLPVDEAMAFETALPGMEARFLDSDTKDPKGFFETDPEGKEYNDAAKAARAATEVAALRPAQFKAAFDLILGGLPEGLGLAFAEDRATLREAFLESGSLNATEFLEGHPIAGTFAKAAKERAAGKAVEGELGDRFDTDANAFDLTLTDMDKTAFAKIRPGLKAEFIELGGEGGFDAFIRKRHPEFIARADAQAAAGIAEQERLDQQRDLGKPVGQAIATEISRLQSRIDSGDFSPEETALAQQRLNLLTRFGGAAEGQFGAEAAAGDTQTREEFLAGAFPSPEFAPDPVGGPEGVAAREEAGVAPLDFSRRDILAPDDITTVDRNIEAQFLGAEADAARQFAGLERDPVTGRPNFGSIKGLEGYFPSLEDFNREVQARAAADARRLNQPTDNIGSDIMNQAIAQELAFIRGEGTIDRPGGAGEVTAQQTAAQARTATTTPPRTPPRVRRSR